MKDGNSVAAECAPLPSRKPENCLQIRSAHALSALCGGQLSQWESIESFPDSIYLTVKHCLYSPEQRNAPARHRAGQGACGDPLVGSPHLPDFFVQEISRPAGRDRALPWTRDFLKKIE